MSQRKRRAAPNRKAVVALVGTTWASWLVALPADFSSVDKAGRSISPPYYTWRAIVLVVLITGLSFLFVHCRSLVTRQVVLTSGFVSLGWFIMRASVARTIGANMWFVGVILFSPLFFGFPALGSALAVRAVRRQARPQQQQQQR